MYLIKWLGYPEEENTWEKQSNLNCPVVLNRHRARMRYRSKKQLKDTKNKLHKQKPSSYKEKYKKAADKKVASKEVANKKGASKKVATRLLHKQTVQKSCKEKKRVRPKNTTSRLKVRIPLTSLSSEKDIASNEQDLSIQSDNVTSSSPFPQFCCEFVVDSSSCDESFLQEEGYTFPTGSKNPILELPWETTSADIPVSVDFCDYKDFFATDPGETVITHYTTTPSIVSIDGADSSIVSVGSPVPPLTDSNFNLTLSPSLSISSVTSLTTASDVEVVDDVTNSAPVANNNELQATRNHMLSDTTPPRVDTVRSEKEHCPPSSPRFRMTLQRVQRHMPVEYPMLTEANVNGLNYSFNNKEAMDHCMKQPRARRAKDYHQELRQWSAYLNSKCRGKEAPILVENKYDKFPIPKDFEYVCTNLYGKGVPNPADHEPVTYCKCQKCGIGNDGCCPAQLEALFPYYSNGRIRVAPGKPIYECTSACVCGPEWCNRVVQKLRSIPLCIFRTGDAKGWGVKAVTEIKKNSFVSEYTGEVIMFDEAEQRGTVANAKGLTYIFDLDFHSEDDGCCFSIDASKYGNLSHFFNHSVS